MTTIPPIISNHRMFSCKNVPINVADAPIAINMLEKPRIKNREFNTTVMRTFFRFSCSESSSSETPVMNAMYEGMSGKTHGERKEINPAVKATNKLMFSDPGICTPSLSNFKTARFYQISGETV
jgi:hypothetical protein